ncbi:MAG: DUF2116 family Zn-ribbon domain-containing protein [Thermoprotei archaeon]|nr:MAG: DUF2116 family Zn-ribbon domain-containing protein [Thermoprotei archaeon]RLF24865.1 MAG: DUF2116 family Zn-ribbon domain-containing protein [Thermoprotei archaeon]
MSSSKVPDHKHCKVCGKVIPPDREYCSSRCEAIDLKQRREAELYRKWILFLAVVLMIFTLASMLVSLMRP